MPLILTRLDANVVDVISICVKLAAGDDCVLEIEQFLAVQK